jgi:hypothetical protein
LSSGNSGGADIPSRSLYLATILVRVAQPVHEYIFVDPHVPIGEGMTTTNNLGMHSTNIDID